MLPPLFFAEFHYFLHWGMIIGKQQHIDEGVTKQQVIQEGIGDEKCPKDHIVSSK